MDPKPFAFWGVLIKPDAPLHLDLQKGETLHVSMASLGENLNNKKGRSVVYVSTSNIENKFAVCVLNGGKCESVALDIQFNRDAKLGFSVSGKNEVHISGNMSFEDEGDDKNDDEEDVVEEEDCRDEVKMDQNPPDEHPKISEVEYKEGSDEEDTEEERQEEERQEEEPFVKPSKKRPQAKGHTPGEEDKKSENEGKKTPKKKETPAKKDKTPAKQPKKVSGIPMKDTTPVKQAARFRKPRKRRRLLPSNQSRNRKLLR